MRNLTVDYTARFIRDYRRLQPDLKSEIVKKIELFKNRENHKVLEVHKLHGKMKDRYSFSVNYRYRIVFRFEDKNTVALLTVGDHDIYQL